MTFNRVFVLALVVAMVGDVDHATDLNGLAKFIVFILIYVVGRLLWGTAPDPLPGAVKRGLEDFAREYRK